MLRKLTLAAGVSAIIALATGPQATMAGAIGPYTPIPGTETSAPEIVQFGPGRCRFWARSCAAEWGWRSRRWFRCMSRHGCGRDDDEDDRRRR
jgi:hypothetical protein